MYPPNKRYVNTGIIETQLIGIVADLTRYEFRVYVLLQHLAPFTDLQRIAGILDPSISVTRHTAKTETAGKKKLVGNYKLINSIRKTIPRLKDPIGLLQVRVDFAAVIIGTLTAHTKLILIHFTAPQKNLPPTKSPPPSTVVGTTNRNIIKGRDSTKSRQ